MEKVQQFHAWLQKINNVYLTDDNRLAIAFEIILKSTKE